MRCQIEVLGQSKLISSFKLHCNLWLGKFYTQTVLEQVVGARASDLETLKNGSTVVRTVVQIQAD